MRGVRWVCWAVLALSLVGCGEEARGGHLGTVNRVLGDVSWVEARGRLPSDADDEDERIAVHLAYVEAELRARPTGALAAEQREARRRNLDALRAYREAGRFPRNDDHVDARRPTFIDDAGRICAVGHLLAEELGWEVAEAIAQEHKYDYLPDIDHPALTRWASSSGLTGRELAMIQPTYDYREARRPPRAPRPSQTDVRAALRRIEPHVKRCAQADAPASKGGEAQAGAEEGGADAGAQTPVEAPRVYGVVRVRLTWSASTGRVRSIKVLNEGDLGSVGECVVKALRRRARLLTLKPFEGSDLSVTAPFHLSR